MSYSFDDYKVSHIICPSIIPTWRLPIDADQYFVLKNFWDYMMNQILYNEHCDEYMLLVITEKTKDKYPEYEHNIEATKDFLFKIHGTWEDE